MIEYMLVFVLSITGYHMPSVKPSIEYRSDRWFLKNVCTTGPCSAKMAVSNNGVVFIRGNGISLKDVTNQALLVHELTHYLQLKTYGPAKNCKERIRREREALMVEVFYLNRYQRFANPRMIGKQLKRYSCFVLEELGDIR